MNFDTGNFLRLLDDPIAGMEKLAPYVFATHIKDLKIEPSANPTDWFFFAGVPVGMGLIDNQKLAEILHKNGYKRDSLPLRSTIRTVTGLALRMKQLASA